MLPVGLILLTLPMLLVEPGQWHVGVEALEVSNRNHLLPRFRLIRSPLTNALLGI